MKSFTPIGLTKVNFLPPPLLVRIVVLTFIIHHGFSARLLLAMGGVIFPGNVFILFSLVVVCEPNHTLPLDTSNKGLRDSHSMKV